MKNLVIFLISGQSRRLNHPIPKQFHSIKDRYLFEYALETFENHKSIDHILIICLKDYLPQVQKAITEKKYQKVMDIVNGGQERYDSVYAGITYYWKHFNDLPSKVLIHDGARPFVTHRIIEDNLKTLEDTQCCSTVNLLTDTLIEANDKTIHQTLDRSKYRACQTPQGFHLKTLKEMYDQFYSNPPASAVTDDTSLFQYYYPTQSMKCVLGSPLNFKVTTNMDMLLCKSWIQENY